jgi:hypothetical protein
MCVRAHYHTPQGSSIPTLGNVAISWWWQFPGIRQRNTPVGPFHKYLELHSQLPAPAKSMRGASAAGDPDLVQQAMLDKMS